MIKKLNYTLILFFLGIMTYAQSRKNSVIVVESMPIFKGELMQFINENIEYPQSAIKDSISGRVFVSFWVDKSGNTLDHKIVKSIREDLDQEALRITKLIRFDKLTMQGGKPVKIKYTTVPVEFILNSTSAKEKKGIHITD